MYVTSGFYNVTMSSNCFRLYTVMELLFLFRLAALRRRASSSVRWHSADESMCFLPAASHRHVLQRHPSPPGHVVGDSPSQPRRAASWPRHFAQPPRCGAPCSLFTAKLPLHSRSAKKQLVIILHYYCNNYSCYWSYFFY